MDGAWVSGVGTSVLTLFSSELSHHHRANGEHDSAETDRDHDQSCNEVNRVTLVRLCDSNVHCRSPFNNLFAGNNDCAIQPVLGLARGK